MPKVGNKTFPYTAEGEKKAREEAKKKGKKMQTSDGYTFKKK